MGSVPSRKNSQCKSSRTAACVQQRESKKMNVVRTQWTRERIVGVEAKDRLGVCAYSAGVGVRSAVFCMPL